MSIRIVRLGHTPRRKDEGLRIGTVRRPPRGVPKKEWPVDWFDVWFPNLAPSAGTMKLGQSVETTAQWNAFARKYRAEMNTPENSHTLDVFAALSHEANFAVGCYCEDESRCHRSLLRELLAARGAEIEGK
ncbi:MAG TPA: DUF488 family protein [Candidatus Krumholzibacteria bacterium]|nr:DUF488 family protein [Candidatus Krumholzibacteria bacterium]